METGESVEIVRADPRYRRWVLAIGVVAIAALAAVLYFAQSYIGQAMARLHRNPSQQAVDAFQADLRLMLAGVLTLTVVGAFPLLVAGIRVVQARRYPLPGAKVVVDTPVATGRAAALRGWGLIGVGTLFIAAGAAALAAWHMVQ